MSYTIEDLRTRLFEAIDGVKAGTLSVQQAQTISDLSQVIVNSAKVEVDYLRATEDAEASKFLGNPKADGGDKALPNGITGVTRHRLK